MKKICIILVLALLGVGASWFLFKKELDQKDQKLRAQQLLLKSVESLQREWTYAMSDHLWSEGKLNCLELGSPKETHPQFLRCNIDYLKCLYRNKFVDQKDELQVSFKTESVYSRQLENGGELPRGVSFAYLVKLEEVLTGVELAIFLNPSCHETQLPERVYGYGEFNSERIDLDWRFDTFDRKIFVDKFPVSVSEINTYRSIKNLPSMSGSPASPAINVTLREQMDYCHFRGKRILEAHFFDAMSFHPLDRDNDRIQVLRRSPYPWSRIANDSFFTKNEALTKENCDQAYIKECVGRFDRTHYSMASASWLGATHLLGFEMESMRNPLEPRNNLKVSSYFFPKNSKWHRLGRRGHWDGEGFVYRNMNFRLEEPEGADRLDYNIAFRCMREQ